MLPCFLAWLGLSFSTCYKVGKGFDWTTTQVLQVHRSLQCGLLAGMGLFAMGIMTGQVGKLPSRTQSIIFDTM